MSSSSLGIPSCLLPAIRKLSAKLLLHLVFFHRFQVCTTAATLELCDGNLTEGGHLLPHVASESQNLETPDDAIQLLQSFFSVRALTGMAGTLPDPSAEFGIGATNQPRASLHVSSIARALSNVDPIIPRKQDGIHMNFTLSMHIGKEDQLATSSAFHGQHMAHSHQHSSLRHAHESDAALLATKGHALSSQRNTNQVASDRMSRADPNGIVSLIVYLILLAVGVKGVVIGILIVLFIVLHLWLLSPSPQTPTALTRARPASPATGSGTGADAPTMPAPDAESGEKQEVGTEAVRICYVCMTERINSVAIPCRHSSMCRSCMVEVLNRKPQCPICRSYISYPIYGFFDSDFVDFAGKFVHAVTGQAHDARVEVYTGMFHRIRGLVTLAIIAAIASLVFFFVVPVHWLAVSLAVYALCIGYVPWFAVTVAAFEKEDRSLRADFFSDQDSTCKLLGKVLLFLIVGPIAIAVFFLPYAVFALIVRPLFTKVLPVLLAANLAFLLGFFCLTWLYIIHPIGDALKTLWRGLVNMVFIPLGRGIVNLCNFSYSVLMGIGQAITAVGNFFYNWVLVPIGQGIHDLAVACWEYVLVPIGDGLAWLFEFSERALIVCFVAINEWVILPAGHGIYFAADAFRTYIVAPIYHGLTATASAFYSYVLVPIANGISACCTAFKNGIVFLAVSFYAYILVPIGEGLLALVRGIATGLSNLFTALYEYVLSPIWSGIKYVFTSLYEGVSWLFTSFYVYLLAPLGEFITYVVTALFTGLSNLLTAFYVYVLTPIGTGIAWVATAVYEHVLRPIAIGIGSAVAAVARWVANVFSAIFEGIVNIATATGNAISNIATATGSVFHDIFNIFIPA